MEAPAFSDLVRDGRAETARAQNGDRRHARTF
jgi:hypothetical protein